MENKTRLSFQLSEKDYLNLVLYFHRPRLITFAVFVTVFEILVLSFYFTRDYSLTTYLVFILLALPALLLLIYFNLFIQSRKAYRNDPTLTKEQSLEIDSEKLKVTCASGVMEYNLKELYAYVFTSSYVYFLISPVKVHIVPLISAGSEISDQIRNVASASIDNSRYLKSRRNNMIFRIMFFGLLMFIYVYMLMC